MKFLSMRICIAAILCGLTVAAIACAAVPEPVSIPAKGAEECASLGFISSEVLCDHCDALLQRTGEKNLGAECKACCTKDKQGRDAAVESKDQLRYEAVRLEGRSAKWMIQNNAGELGEFWNSHHSEFDGRLTVLDRQDVLYSRLVFYNTSNDATPLVTQIAGWDSGTIYQYLNKQLTPAAQKEK